MKKLTIIIGLLFIGCSTPEVVKVEPQVFQKSFVFNYTSVLDNGIRKIEIGTITYNEATGKVFLADALNPGYNLIEVGKDLSFWYEALPLISTKGDFKFIAANKLQLKYSKLNQSEKVKVYEN